MKQWLYLISLVTLLLSLVISFIDIQVGIVVGLISSVVMIFTSTLIIKEWNDRE